MKRLLATIPALLLSACGFAVVAPAVDASTSFYHVELVEAERSICPSRGAPCTALPNVFHPDFAAHCEKIAAERCAANSPIAPGETWCPASPLSARLYRKPAEGNPR